MENKIIKAGTKIVIGMGAGFAGSESMNAYILTRDYAEDQLGDIAWQEGLQHAEMYGIYPRDWDWDLDNDEDEGGDQYSDNIEGWWALYDENEHAGHCTTSNDVIFEEL